MTEQTIAQAGLVIIGLVIGGLFLATLAAPILSSIISKRRGE